jgi:hypothetical protein
MNGELPSATPEKGGGEASAPKHPDKEGQGEPKKDSKFTVKQIFEFGGLAGVLIVLAEMIGCHDFVPLIIYAMAVNLVSLLPLHFVYELLKKRKAWIPILIWIALFMTSVLIVYENSRPPPMAAKPHLELKLAIISKSFPPPIFPQIGLEMTNDFLIFTNQPMVITGMHARLGQGQRSRTRQRTG